MVWQAGKIRLNIPSKPKVAVSHCYTPYIVVCSCDLVYLSSVFKELIEEPCHPFCSLRNADLRISSPQQRPQRVGRRSCIRKLLLSRQQFYVRVQPAVIYTATTELFLTAGSHAILLASSHFVIEGK